MPVTIVPSSTLLVASANPANNVQHSRFGPVRGSESGIMWSKTQADSKPHSSAATKLARICAHERWFCELRRPKRTVCCMCVHFYVTRYVQNQRHMRRKRGN